MLKKFISENKILIVTAISFVFVVLYKLILIDIREIFPKGYEIGELSYNIALTVLTSSIFYYFVNYLKEQETKKKLAETINNRLGHLTMMKSIIYQAVVSKSTYKELPKRLPDDYKLFVEICSNISLRSMPPVYWNSEMIQFNDWFEYFEYTFMMDRYNIDILFKYSNVINADTLNMFNEVMHTTFHSGIRQYKTSTETYANQLSSLAGPLHNYLTILGSFENDCWK